jgi:hypothetical protein
MEKANIIKIDSAIQQKMKFIMNALENGWSVKKIEDQYVFTKKHEGRREVFMTDYLEKFIEKNMGL